MRGFLANVLIVLTAACGGSSADQSDVAVLDETDQPTTSTAAIPPTTTTSTTTTTAIPATTTTSTTTTTAIPPTTAEPETTAAAGPLVGLWVTHHGYYVLRTADGAYNLGYTPEGAESAPFGWGAYTFDEQEGILTFTSDAGTHCGADSTGVYEAVITDDGDTVTFTLVEDPCSVRPGNMTGEQTRYSPTQ